MKNLFFKILEILNKETIENITFSDNHNYAEFKLENEEETLKISIFREKTDGNSND